MSAKISVAKMAEVSKKREVNVRDFKVVDVLQLWILKNDLLDKAGPCHQCKTLWVVFGSRSNLEVSVFHTHN